MEATERAEITANTTPATTEALATITDTTTTPLTVAPTTSTATATSNVVTSATATKSNGAATLDTLLLDATTSATGTDAAAAIETTTTEITAAATTTPTPTIETEIIDVDAVKDSLSQCTLEQLIKAHTESSTATTSLKVTPQVNAMQREVGGSIVGGGGGGSVGAAAMGGAYAVTGIAVGDIDVEAGDTKEKVQNNEKATGSVALAAVGDAAASSAAAGGTASSAVTRIDEVPSSGNAADALMCDGIGDADMDDMTPTASIRSIGSFVCRICHNAENPERLVSPCLCKGSLTYVHIHCLERWISTSRNTICELCQFQYNTEQTLRYTCLQSLRMWYSRSMSRRALQEDCQMFSLLTLVVFAIVGTLLVGIQYYFMQGRSWGLGRLWSKGWLMFFLLTTLFVYFINIYIIVRSQLTPWYRWWQSARDIKLILENRKPFQFRPRRWQPRPIDSSTVAAAVAAASSSAASMLPNAGSAIDRPQQQQPHYLPDPAYQPTTATAVGPQGATAAMLFSQNVAAAAALSALDVIHQTYGSNSSLINCNYKNSKYNYKTSEVLPLTAAEAAAVAGVAAVAATDGGVAATAAVVLPLPLDAVVYELATQL